MLLLRNATMPDLLPSIIGRQASSTESPRSSDGCALHSAPPQRTPKMMEMAPVMMAVRWPLAIEGSSTAGRFGCSWLLPPAPPLLGWLAPAALCCCCLPSPSAARHSSARRLGVVDGSQARRARRAAGRTGASAAGVEPAEDAMGAAAGAKARWAGRAVAAIAAEGSGACQVPLDAIFTVNGVSRARPLCLAPCLLALAPCKSGKLGCAANPASASSRDRSAAPFQPSASAAQRLGGMAGPQLPPRPKPRPRAPGSGPAVRSEWYGNPAAVHKAG